MIQLSKRTIEVLKNFATINNSLVLQPGKIQRTVATPHSTIIAEAELTEEFPVVFGIYDLNQFVGNLTTIDSPTLEFEGNAVTISGSGLSINYAGCVPGLIMTEEAEQFIFVGKKDLTIKAVDDQFVLQQSLLEKIMRLANLNNLPHLSILAKDKKLFLRAHDRKIDSTSANAEVGSTEGDDSRTTFSTLNLKIIPDDYHVELVRGRLAHLVNKDKNLQYYIASEKEKK